MPIAPVADKPIDQPLPRIAQASYHLLRNHATHANAHEMYFPCSCPSDMTDELQGIASHLRSRISHQWLVRVAHTSIVEDEA